jgi:hypothetical protein
MAARLDAIAHLNTHAHVCVTHDAPHHGTELTLSPAHTAAELSALPGSIDRNERDQFATAEPATAEYRLTEAQLCPVDLGQQVQTRVRSAESGPLNAASGCGLHQLGVHVP